MNTKTGAAIFLFLFVGLSGLPDAGAADLPPGPGRDQVVQNCTACHSAAIILQNRMTRERWDETITWMQEKQGLWELEPDLRNTILDYLSRHFGAGAPAKGASGEAPRRRRMYPYDYPPNPL